MLSVSASRNGLPPVRSYSGSTSSSSPLDVHAIEQLLDLARSRAARARCAAAGGDVRAPRSVRASIDVGRRSERALATTSTRRGMSHGAQLPDDVQERVARVVEVVDDEHDRRLAPRARRSSGAAALDQRRPRARRLCGGRPAASAAHVRRARGRCRAGLRAGCATTIASSLVGDSQRRLGQHPRERVDRRAEHVVDVYREHDRVAARCDARPGAGSATSRRRARLRRATNRISSSIASARLANTCRYSARGRRTAAPPSSTPGAAS